MSATGRKAGVRRADDFYETPAWCVTALLGEIVMRPSARILEPCAGSGAIVHALMHYGFSNITALEIERKHARISQEGTSWFTEDFFASKAAGFDAVIMNPPYSRALEFVQESMKRATTVCALLRLNWLASRKRSVWLQDNTPDVYVLSKRPSFTDGKNTDACEYAWMVWGDRQRDPGPATLTIVGAP